MKWFDDVMPNDTLRTILEDQHRKHLQIEGKMDKKPEVGAGAKAVAVANTTSTTSDGGAGADEEEKKSDAAKLASMILYESRLLYFWPAELEGAIELHLIDEVDEETDAVEFQARRGSALAKMGQGAGSLLSDPLSAQNRKSVVNDLEIGPAVEDGKTEETDAADIICFKKVVKPEHHGELREKMFGKSKPAGGDPASPGTSPRVEVGGGKAAFRGEVPTAHGKAAPEHKPGGMNNFGGHQPGGMNFGAGGGQHKPGGMNFGAGGGGHQPGGMNFGAGGGMSSGAGGVSRIGGSRKDKNDDDSDQDDDGSSRTESYVDEDLEAKKRKQRRIMLDYLLENRLLKPEHIKQFHYRDLVYKPKQTFIKCIKWMMFGLFLPVLDIMAISSQV